MRSWISGVFLAFVIMLPLVGTTGDRPAMSSNRASAILSDSPTIDWFGGPPNSTSMLTIAWDGYYHGQQQEVWRWNISVGDADGILAVVFRFRWGWSGYWFNRTTTRFSGNYTNGVYSGNLTWYVTWDWMNGGISESRPSDTFCFKVYAVDVLGAWTETSTVCYMGGYMIIDALYLMPLGRILIVSCAIILLLTTATIIFYFRRRR